MLDKPEQFGVYRGRVSNVMEFGCFVELLGFRTKAEGLVHLANMAKTRRAYRPTPNAHQSVYIVLNSCVCLPLISQTMVPMYASTVSKPEPLCSVCGSGLPANVTTFIWSSPWSHWAHPGCPASSLLPVSGGLTV